MATFTKFEDLDDEEFFVGLITDHFQHGWEDIADLVKLHPIVDEARVRYAFNEYRQNLSKFQVLLHSQNPDHTKRAGALLHALYQAEVIQECGIDPAEIAELEAGTAIGVSFGDAEHRLTLVEFYRDYHNQIIAFDIAYRCCSVYDPAPPPYDFNYLHNICYYLNENNNLNVGSLAMIFKSLIVR